MKASILIGLTLPLLFHVGFITAPYTKAYELARIAYTATMQRVDAFDLDDMDYDAWSQASLYQPKPFTWHRKNLIQAKDLLVQYSFDTPSDERWVKSVSTSAVTGAVTLELYDKTNILVDCGLPSDFWDVTPYSGLTTHTNSWIALSNILSKLTTCTKGPNGFSIYKLGVHKTNDWVEAEGVAATNFLTWSGFSSTSFSAIASSSLKQSTNTVPSEVTNNLHVAIEGHQYTETGCPQNVKTTSSDTYYLKAQASQGSAVFIWENNTFTVLVENAFVTVGTRASGTSRPQTLFNDTDWDNIYTDSGTPITNWGWGDATIRCMSTYDFDM